MEQRREQPCLRGLRLSTTLTMQPSLRNQVPRLQILTHTQPSRARNYKRSRKKKKKVLKIIPLTDVKKSTIVSILTSISRINTVVSPVEQEKSSTAYRPCNTLEIRMRQTCIEYLVGGGKQGHRPDCIVAVQYILHFLRQLTLLLLSSLF